MKSKTWFSACCLGIFGICFAQAAHAQVTDRIFDAKKGLATNGTIVRMTNTTVYIESGGAEKAFKIEEIRKVTFADEPVELDRARDLVIDGRYNDALTELTKIDRDNVKIDFILKDINFYLGLCAAKLALRGEFKPGTEKAIDFVNGFVAEPANKNNFHYYEAVEVLADLHYGTGDYVKGEAAYLVLFDGPAEMNIRARVQHGQCLVGQEKYPEALASFKVVVDAKDLSAYANGAEQQLFARLGHAICVAAAGQADAAIAEIEKIIQLEDPSNMALFGRAYNALGSCYQKAGKPKDALLAYLHTDVLFRGDPNVHAEALYHLSQLWETENRQDRALRAREMLKNSYSASVWRRKAG